MTSGLWSRPAEKQASDRGIMDFEAQKFANPIENEANALKTGRVTSVHHSGQVLFWHRWIELKNCYFACQKFQFYIPIRCDFFEMLGTDFYFISTEKLERLFGSPAGEILIKQTFSEKILKKFSGAREK